jgi:agmatinase
MYTIVKIPFDKCIVGSKRRGAALGPGEIEKELKSHAKDLQKMKFVEIKEKDDFEKLHREVETIAGKEYKAGNFVIGLGGDHSVSYGLMKAFFKYHKNAALIYFDAHLDCEDDFLPPTHEDIIRAAVNERFFEPENILMVGSRKAYPKETKFVKEKGIRLGKLEDIKNFIDGKNDVYISIDIDVFDPKFAPGTGYPEENGLKPGEILPIIKELAKSKKIRGIDLVEVSPPKDANNMTSKLAAKILVEFLGNNTRKPFV